VWAIDLASNVGVAINFTLKLSIRSFRGKTFFFAIERRFPEAFYRCIASRFCFLFWIAMASHGDTAPMELHKGANVNDEMDGDDYHNALRGTTRQDHVDMVRMGKVPELQRNYRPLSALAFTVILQGTWEVLMT
jgi:hypothetical protein